MITVNLDVLLAERKMTSKTLNLSILKTGKARGIRFETLSKICHELDCQPGDILEYREDESNAL